MDMRTETRPPAVSAGTAETRSAAQTVLAWPQVRDDYLSKRAAKVEAFARAAALSDAAEAAVPIPADLVDPKTGGALWSDDIEALPVSRVLKDRLLSERSRYSERYDAHLTACGYEDADDACDEAQRAENRAYEAMQAFPSPDAGALLFKLAVLWEDDEIEDPAVVAEVLTRRHDYALLRKVEFYRDLARIAGVTNAATEAQAWDVAEFGARFLAVHTGDWSNSGNPGWLENEGDDPTRDASHTLWASLSDWQKAALRDWLKQQPRPTKVDQLEKAVRLTTVPSRDPGSDVNAQASRLQCNGADVAAVLPRLQGLFDAYQKRHAHAAA